MIGAVIVAAVGSRPVRAALRLGLPVLAMLLFLVNLRRAGERAGRASERLDTLENTHDAQRRMLDAAADRPRDRDALARRLRDGRF